MNKLTQWIVKSRLVALIVIALAIVCGYSGLVALSPGVAGSSDAQTPGGDWFVLALVFWAPFIGLFWCYEKRELSLQAWWRGVRAMLVLAALTIVIAWLGVAFERVLPATHAKWVRLSGNVVGAVRPAIIPAAIGLMCAILVWYFVLPALRAYREGRKG